MDSGYDELSAAVRRLRVEVVALIDHEYDRIDIEPPHDRPTEPLDSAVGIVVVGRVARRVVGVHSVSLSDYRNRLDPESEPDNLSGAVSAHAHRRLLVNRGGMTGGRVGSSAPNHVN